MLLCNNKRAWMAQQEQMLSSSSTVVLRVAQVLLSLWLGCPAAVGSWPMQLATMSSGLFGNPSGVLGSQISGTGAVRNHYPILAPGCGLNCARPDSSVCHARAATAGTSSHSTGRWLLLRLWGEWSTPVCCGFQCAWSPAARCSTSARCAWQRPRLASIFGRRDPGEPVSGSETVGGSPCLHTATARWVYVCMYVCCAGMVT
jgi:hypothetical protein